MLSRVLIVDDSSMMRKIIKKLLEPAGYEIVGEASSGEEAIEKYKTLKPDLVTMDITMRGMDGLTAAQEIMTFDKDAKVLFMSNLDEEKYKAEIERIGGLGIVNKHDTKETLELLATFG